MATWSLMQSCAELEQQGYKSLLEGAFVLVCDRDEQHLVQVKACHPDHNMQPVLTIQVIQHLHAKVMGGLRIFQICILVCVVASLHLSIACMQVKHAGGAFPCKLTRLQHKRHLASRFAKSYG